MSHELLEKIGNVVAVRGDLEAALASHLACLEIAEGLAASDPGNAGWQRDIWVSIWRFRNFPQSGITCSDIVALMEAMKQAGTLRPMATQCLEHAKAEAQSQ